MTDNATATSRPNPYVGPRSFRPGEKLYGRTRETFELVNLLMAERIVLMYSPPGAGKSSMINAAVMPDLVEQGYRILPVVRVNTEPPKATADVPGFNRYVYSMMLSIESGLENESLVFPKEELYSLTFPQYLEKYRERARNTDPNYDEFSPSVLFIDQMEEVVTLNPTDIDDKKAFFSQLGTTLDDPQIFALCAIREDYLATLDPYLLPIPGRFSSRFRLNLLDVGGGLEAMQAPAKDNGVDYREDAARKLLDDLRTITVQQADGSTTLEKGLYVEPVYLQVVCRRLWMQLDGDNTDITMEDVQALGDVNKALSDYYSLQVASVAGRTNTKERFIRQWFDRKLITPQGLRGQVLMGLGWSDGLANRVVQELEQGYLVRAEKRSGATWFELSHDRLIEPIHNNNAEWFEEHLSALQRQAEVWHLEGHPDGMLLTGPDYLSAQVWADNNHDDMTDIEKEFIEACAKLHKSIQRDRAANLAIRWLFGFTFIFAMVSTFFFLRSQVLEHRAVAREMAANAISNLDRDPALSILLILDSLQETDTLSVHNLRALHRALPQLALRRIMTGHKGKVYSVSYKNDSDWAVSAGNDGKLILWNVSNGTSKNELQVTTDGTGLSRAVFSPNARHVAVLDKNGMLYIVNADTWAVEKQAQAHDGEAWALAYSPDGSFFITGGEDQVAIKWDAKTLEPLMVFGIKNCAYSNSCGQFNEGDINDVALSQDGKLLITSGDDGFARIWDTETGQMTMRFDSKAGHSGAVLAAIFSPDGKKIASAGDDRTIKIWDIASGNVEMNITGHFDWVYALQYTEDGSKLISASADRTIRFWETTYGREVEELTGHTGQVFDIQVSTDGKYLLSASEDGTVRLWEIAASAYKELATYSTKDNTYSVAYSPDSKYLAVATRSNSVEIWNRDTHSFIKELVKDGHTGTVYQAAWTLDGHVVSVGKDGKALVWDVQAGTPIMQGPSHNKDRITTVDTGKKDASLVVTGGNDSLVRVWRADTGEQLAELDVLNPDIFQLGKQALLIDQVRFSPDDEYVAVAYYTAETPVEVVIWDWKKNTILVAPWEKGAFDPGRHTDIVRGVAFNNDGSLLASVGEDSTLIIYDVRQKKVKDVWPNYHIGAIFDIAFSPDGKLLATAGADSQIKVMDMDNGKVLYTLYGHTDRVYSVVFSPDGKHIASASTDKTIREFITDSNELEALARARLAEIPRTFSESECWELFDTVCDEVNNPNLFQRFITYLTTVFP